MSWRHHDVPSICIVARSFDLTASQRAWRHQLITIHTRRHMTSLTMTSHDDVIRHFCTVLKLATHSFVVVNSMQAYYVYIVNIACFDILSRVFYTDSCLIFASSHAVFFVMLGEWSINSWRIHHTFVCWFSSAFLVARTKFSRISYECVKYFAKNEGVWHFGDESSSISFLSIGLLHKEWTTVWVLILANLTHSEKNPIVFT